MKIKMVRKPFEEYEVYNVYWDDFSKKRLHMYIPDEEYQALLVVSNRDCEIIDYDLSDFLVVKTSDDDWMILHKALILDDLLDEVLEWNESAMKEFKKRLKALENNKYHVDIPLFYKHPGNQDQPQPPNSPPSKLELEENKNFVLARGKGLPPGEDLGPTAYFLEYAEEVFQYLIDEYGFRLASPDKNNPGPGGYSDYQRIYYKKGGITIRLVTELYGEVFLEVNLQDTKEWFSISGFFRPEEYQRRFEYRAPMYKDAPVLKSALQKLSELLKKYGEPLLKGDETFFVILKFYELDYNTLVAKKKVRRRLP